MTWLDMAENCWKWLKQLDMAGYGCKWLEMARMAEIACKWLELAVNGCNSSVNGYKWLE